MTKCITARFADSSVVAKITAVAAMATMTTITALSSQQLEPNGGGGSKND